MVGADGEEVACGEEIEASKNVSPIFAVILNQSNLSIQTIGDGCITASGRSSNDSNWYVIDSSIVQGTGTAYLGRPWRDYARVVFQNTYLHSNV